MKKQLIIFGIILMLIIVGLGGCNEKTIEEGEAPVINYFTVSPPTVKLGSHTSVLNWSVTGATSVSIDNGIGNVASNGSYRVVSTKYKHFYNLTASNAYGTNKSTVIVLVYGALPTHVLKTISAINTEINQNNNFATYEVIRTDEGLLWANLSVSWEGGGGPFGVNITAISAGTNITVGDHFTIFFGADGKYSPDILYDENIIWAAQTLTV